MATSPFALSLFAGIDSAVQRTRAEHTDGETPNQRAVRETLGMRLARASRRPTSHYNPFQTVCSTSQDEPPSYANATSYKPSPAFQPSDREALPGYTCTVATEGKFLLRLESINPLHGALISDWREVYAVLRGTLLSFFRVKDGGAGKLLRAYTLQHAEVGLATDSEHTILVPQTRLAQLIPSGARNRAWRRDPGLFKAARQTILRLRVETDQLLIADSCEETIHELVNKLSTAIDISPSIDERSVPKQCTVPRRRRRRGPQTEGELNDPALLAEQERILRSMYPAFAEHSSHPGSVAARTPTEETPSEPIPPTTREEDDLDLAIIREDFASTSGTAAPAPPHVDPATRPAMSRQTTASTLDSLPDPTDFDAAGKWEPAHPRTPAQIQRYARRCLPILPMDAVRASDVLICHGRRVKINWRMELLEEWELRPPSYRAHRFPAAEDGATPLERCASRISSSTAASTSIGAVQPSSTTTASLPPDASETLLRDPAKRAPPSPSSSQCETKSPAPLYVPAARPHSAILCF